MTNYSRSGLIDPVLFRTNCSCQPDHYCFRMKGWRYPEFCLPSWINPAKTLNENIQAEIENRNTLHVSPGTMLITIIILTVLIIFLVAAISLVRRERFIWKTDN